MLVETVTAVPANISTCPLIPVTCAFEAAEVAANVASDPFGSFWDAFFVSSPAEALRAPLELIWAVPQADFDADWFRDTYSNVLFFYGLGISILVLFASLFLAALPGRSVADVLNVFTDWLVTLTQIAFMPIFSASILWVSAVGGKAIMRSADINKPTDFLDLVNSSFFEIGWMSLAARLIGTLLVLEIIVLYLVQILATFSSPFIVPLRGVNDAGRDWYVRMVRGILFGLAPLVMSIVIWLMMLLLNGADKFGAPGFFNFVGVVLALGLAGWVPLKLSKKSRPYVAKLALRLTESYVRPFESNMRPSRHTAGYEQHVQRRQERRAERGKLVRDLGLVAIGTAASGGAGASMAVSAGKSKSVARVVGAFQRNATNRQRTMSIIDAKNQGAKHRGEKRTGGGQAS